MLLFCRNNINDLKLEEVTIRRGLGLFKIEQQPSKDLLGLDKDLDYIDQVYRNKFRFSNKHIMQPNYDQTII